MTEPNSRPEDSDPARTFRIGHKERDEAIELLRTAAGDGRITVDELSERMEAVAAAKFPVDLDEVLGDLTTDLPSDRFRPSAEVVRRPRVPGVGRAVPGRGRGWDPRDPLVLKASMESERRRGKWPVPPYIRCEPSMSTIELNFLEVDTDLREIEVDVIGTMGTLTIIVPEGWGVDIEELSRSWGSVKSSVDVLPRGGGPTVVVTGTMGMGTFRARHANYFDRRRMAM